MKPIALLLTFLALALALAGGGAAVPETPTVPRAAHSATLLAFGEVLVAGGGYDDRIAIALDAWLLQPYG